MSYLHYSDELCLAETLTLAEKETKLEKCADTRFPPPATLTEKV